MPCSPARRRLYEWGIIHWADPAPDPIDLADVDGVELTDGDADRLLAHVAGELPFTGSILRLFKRQHPDLYPEESKP